MTTATANIDAMTYRISSREDDWGMLLADGRAIGLVRKPAIVRPEYTADQVCRALRVGRDRLAEMVAAKG